HRPGCARGGTGAGLTEISGIPAYNPVLPLQGRGSFGPQLRALRVLDPHTLQGLGETAQLLLVLAL
ncbi:hypothetical protein, partial [Pseudomonas sp. FSL R10-2172]|uniref:hypothetical protein n=1 Tax=Pseudomonas sp. FSL R10-2172 TaxID=2662198 RepID=UPI001C49B059